MSLAAAEVQTVSPIRVAIVDDEESVAENLARHVKQFPACGIEIVGCFTRNSPGFPKQLRAAGAMVVLVDLNLGRTLRHPDLGPDELNGIGACAAIRSECGSAIRIVAHSQFRELRADAMNRGADWFHDKGTTEDLVSIIQTIIRNPIPRSPTNTSIAKLGLERSRLRVTVAFKGEERPFGFTLEPLAFALLWFHAEERRRNAAGWLTFDGLVKGVWTINNTKVWREINTRSGTSRAGDVQIESSFLIACRNKVNGELRGRLDGRLLVICQMNSGGPPLPLISAGRPRQGEIRVSCLSLSIQPEAIEML